MYEILVRTLSIITNLHLDFFCILHAYTGLACSDSAGKCEGKEQGKNKEERREREPGEKCFCVCVCPPSTSQSISYKRMFIFIKYTIITCKIIRE